MFVFFVPFNVALRRIGINAHITFVPNITMCPPMDHEMWTFFEFFGLSWQLSMTHVKELWLESWHHMCGISGSKNPCDPSDKYHTWKVFHQCESLYAFLDGASA